VGKICLIVAALALGGCSSGVAERELQAAVKPVEVEVKPAPRKQPRPAQRTDIADEQLASVIRARFSASKISANGFEVEVDGGVARIRGSTGVIQHKATATRLAKLAGAKAVDNRIVITEEARRKAAERLRTGNRRKRGDPRATQ
jgi:hypothetical protein